jgi:hypothetical protein
VSDGPEEREPEHPPLTRLDPDAPRRSPSAPDTSSSAAPAPAGPTSPVGGEPVIDTRRYGWMIGIFGLILVIAVSIYQFASHGVGTTGVPPGQRLHYFAAPLALSTLVGDPNLNPPCTLARHDPRALNICLLARRAPLVLSLFVAGSRDCERQVDAMQTLSRRFSPAVVRFAAVAVNASRAATAKLVRSHHWTIPVAYDRHGDVGQIYGMAICPMAELAYRGGIVRDRLIGDQWQTSSALYPHVRALVAAGRHRPS